MQRSETESARPAKRNPRKKKAPAGPAKRTAVPERRAMIAAVRRRIGKAGATASQTVVRWSWRVDRLANRELERLHAWLLRRPPLRRRGGGRRRWPGSGPARGRRPPLFFRGLALADAGLRRACGAAARAATAASRVVTPRRARRRRRSSLAGAAAGRPRSSSTTARSRSAAAPTPACRGWRRPPTVDARTAGDAHAYVLVPVGLLAGAPRAGGDRRGGRPRLGLAVGGARARPRWP